MLAVGVVHGDLNESVPAVVARLRDLASDTGSADVTVSSMTAPAAPGQHHLLVGIDVPDRPACDPDARVRTHDMSAVDQLWHQRRDEYARVKQDLAARPGHDVDDYSLDKMP